ncbi:MAG: VanZ family protein [Clostridia bacterium]|nr:VanZ family protein [Clostridia bacterium]
MKRQKVKFYIWTIISVLIAGVIFLFSAQNGDSSGNVSQSVTQKLFPSVVSFDAIYLIEKIIRKIAHYLIYFFLGVSVTMAYRNYISGFKNKTPCAVKQIITSVSICFVYSLSDEFHQSFIPGRNGSFLDCLLDTAGALSGVLFVLLLTNIFKKISKK